MKQVGGEQARQGRGEVPVGGAALPNGHPTALLPKGDEPTHAPPLVKAGHDADHLGQQARLGQLALLGQVGGGGHAVGEADTERARHLHPQLRRDVVEQIDLGVVHRLVVCKSKQQTPGNTRMRSYSRGG